MIFDIAQLKKIRKQLGLTQHQFAQKSGMSQSMVAKIEAGTLDPTYTYVKKIETAIEALTKHIEKEAKDIMTKTIISATPNFKIKEVIKLFKTYNISQIPIIQEEKAIGLVTESCLVDHAEENIGEKRVEEIMTDSPPIITLKTKLSVILGLLKFYPILLVQEKGKLKGVITKANIIAHI